MYMPIIITEAMRVASIAPVFALAEISRCRFVQDSFVHVVRSAAMGGVISFWVGEGEAYGGGGVSRNGSQIVTGDT